MTNRTRSLASTVAAGSALAAIAVLVRIGVSEGMLAPNISAVASAGLFAAAWCGRRWAGPSVVIAAMLASDLLLGFDLWPITLVIYASLAIPGVLLGPVLARRATPLRIAGAAAGSSLLFFFATNLAVWAFSGLYPVTGNGLAECFAAAIPFAKYTFAGDLFFSAVFFATPVGAAWLLGARRVRQAA